MTPKLFLRIAAVLLMIHLLGHAAGHMKWDKPEDAGMQQAVAAMKAHKAPFMGAVKSMADYYNAYSLMMFGLFFMSICILWIAPALLSKSDKTKLLLAAVGCTYVYFGIVEYIGFFPFAASMSFFAGLCTLCALLLKPRSN